MHLKSFQSNVNINSSYYKDLKKDKKYFCLSRQLYVQIWEASLAFE